MGEPSGEPPKQLNVLGLPIELCCQDPVTGFFRDGHCHTGPMDHGLHTVCAQMTDEFLSFSVSAGNDLVTPMPQYGFPGLKAGDRWCLCAMRWHQAHEAGKAPRLYLRATHQTARLSRSMCSNSLRWTCHRFTWVNDFASN